MESTVHQHQSHLDGAIKRKKTGRPRRLTSEDIDLLLDAIEVNPHITYAQLTAMVDHPVAASTVHRTLIGLTPPVVQVAPLDVLPVELTDEHQQQLRNFVAKDIRHVPMDTRVYADESYIMSNSAPTTAKTRRGRKVMRARTRWGKKYTLHAYVRQDEVLHWELAKKNADDAEIRRVVLDSVVPELREGDVLIWDRLGRSGRSKAPKAQHYNPEVKAAVEAVGARIQMLPPFGKWLDPVELLFHDLKEHYIQPAYPADTGDQLSYEEIAAIVDNYMNDIAPIKLPGFFRSRANGREARRLGLF